MDATLEIYHYAADKGASRVLLTSSKWMHGDKRFTTEILNSKTAPGPVNAYGMSGLFCERTGAYFVEHKNLSVICMRIGWTQWTHDNKPDTHMSMGLRGQEMWLSDSDFINGIFAAINAENVRFAALNLMSDNIGIRWDINETREIIGYQPLDTYTSTETNGIKFKVWLIRLLTVTTPQTVSDKVPEW